MDDAQMMGLDLSEPIEPVKPVPPKDTFMLDVFGYVESILNSKENLMVTVEDERRYSEIRFMILKALSFYPDVILFVNEINSRPGMSARMEYEFLMGAIPGKKRKANKWSRKAAPSLYMQQVREYYGYNERKAEEAMKLLTIEQLAVIDTKTRKAGDSWTFSGDTESKSD